MQGLRIERDKEYPYKKQIAVPEEFAGGRILLRFDGVYSVGRVWVNGELAEKDIKLYKNANFNYIRTSHYPAPPVSILTGLNSIAREQRATCG